MSIPAHAEKVAAFLAEARQAIAVHGGLNPAALTRLRAAAQLHGLSAVQMSEALRSLGGAKAPAPAKPSSSATSTTSSSTNTPAAPFGILIRDKSKKEPPRKIAGGKPHQFPYHVAAELKKARVLWPPIYERLIADGEQFGLDDIEAMDVIEQVGEKLAIPFVSASDAENRILSRAKEMHDRGELSPDAYTRLREMAAQVGMTGTRFDSMVGQIAQEPEPRRPVWEIAGLPGGVVIGVGAFVILAAAAFIGITILGERSAKTVVQKVEEKPKPKPIAPPTPRAVVQWGTPELADRLKKATNDSLPGLSDTWIHQLGSENAGVRAEGYKVLLESFARIPPPGLDALALCYALEPSAENAEVLFAAMKRDMPPPGNVRPKAEEIDHWFTAAGLAARMIVAPGVPADRAAAVAKQLDYALQVKPDPGATPAEFVKRVETHTAARIYHLVAELARTSPPDAAQLASACRPRFEGFFAPEVLAPLEADIVAAAAAFPEKLPDVEMPRVRILFERVVDSNAAARIRLATVYQTLKPSPMRDLLEEVLLAKTGAARGASTSETAANIRKKADLAKAMNVAPIVDRSQELLALARPLLAAAPPAQPVQLLQESLTLTHYSTLAAALIGGPKPNEQRFAELLAKPPLLPAANAKNAKASGVALQIAEEQKLARMLSNSDVADRKTAFQKLAASLNPDDINIQTANALARFLARVLDKDEIALVNAGLPRIARSPALQLEFADVLQGADSGAKPNIEAALGHLLGQPMTLSANNWKSIARRALLRRVADGGLDDTLNKSAELYRNMLIEQGVMFGLDPADFALRAEPSTIFEVLIRHLITKLARDKLTDDDRRVLEQLPHYNTAIDFQKLNDLQKTVLMQRVWLRVVCLYVAQQKPANAERAAKILEEIAIDDAKTDDVLARLRIGEAKLLSAWLLMLDAP